MARAIAATSRYATSYRICSVAKWPRFLLITRQAAIHFAFITASGLGLRGLELIMPFLGPA